MKIADIRCSYTREFCIAATKAKSEKLTGDAAISFAHTVAIAATAARFGIPTSKVKAILEVGK